MVTGYFQVNYIVSVTPTYNTQLPPVFPNGTPAPTPPPPFNWTI